MMAKAQKNLNLFNKKTSLLKMGLRIMRPSGAHGFIEMNEETENPSPPPASDSREISKDEIKSILSEHNIWVRSAGAEGKAADFERAHLKGVVLIGANLREANFQGANLYGAYLKKAGLERCDLKGANLRGANLRWANLKNANLKGSNLIRADLREANLEQTQLQGANLKMAEGLTREQINAALVDEATVLPDYLKK